MSRQRHHKAMELFVAANDLSPERVGPFLEQACGDDKALRAEVDSLLAHHQPTTIIAGSPLDDETGKLRLPTAGMFERSDPGDRASTNRSAKDGSRLETGTIIAGRYRILGRLGRGGMGEVFRADDLKLDQSVALKFLTPGRDDDAQWNARFLDEVRLSRRVTHPNVTRVFDIGDANGRAFISMEYVDGEDMASLLRRIGRLPDEKMIDVARGICAGLGAAHDQGVLHRDLKPANIMLDGQGRVRITDFGIAASIADIRPGVGIAGTQSFMAPELFTGEPPSVQSDLYALGLVLYEAVTGKQPFDGRSADQHSTWKIPPDPAETGVKVDPALAQTIVACLNRDPRRRPESAYAVMAALPGGDPLSATIRSGKTPSPDLIAASTSGRKLSPLWANMLLATAFAGLLAVMALADQTFFLPQAGLKKPPAVLAEQAGKVIEQFGHESNPRGHRQGFTIDRGYLKYMSADPARHRRWRSLADGQPPAVFFWYREGDQRLLPPPPLGEPSLHRKLPAEPGMTTVRLDGQDRLLTFSIIPLPADTMDPSRPMPKMTDAFKLAGLDPSRFKSIAPVRPPPSFADHVAAWKGTYPDKPNIPLRVEAASLGGKIIYFEVIPPWRTAQPAGSTSRLMQAPSRTLHARFALYLVAIVGGLVLAWQNYRARRGDLAGASKLSIVVFSLAILDWVIGERHTSVFAEEAMAAYGWIARAAAAAAITWICYMAAEPLVRRHWPRTLVTWSRLLRGHVRDPLVGRDLLIGTTVGIVLVLIAQLDARLPYWFDWDTPIPILPGTGYDLGALLGLRYKVGIVVDVLLTTISLGVVMLVVLSLFRFLTRRTAAAAFLFAALLTLIFATISSTDSALPFLTGALLATLLTLLLTRVGLVALVAALAVNSLITTAPITSNLYAWYAPASIFALLTVAALLTFARCAMRPVRVN